MDTCYAALKARHAKELEEFERKHALTANLPMFPETPTTVMFTKGGCPWVIWGGRDFSSTLGPLRTVEEALAILRAAPQLLEIHAVDDDCLYIGPERHERGKLRWSLPEAASLRLEGGRGFTSAELSAFTRTADERIFRLKVSLAPHILPFRVDHHVRYDRYGNVTESESSLAPQSEARRIKWGSGSRGSYHFELFYSGIEALAKALVREG